MANSLILNGEPLGIRTPDPLIKSRLSLSYLSITYMLLQGSCKGYKQTNIHHKNYNLNKFNTAGTRSRQPIYNFKNVPKLLIDKAYTRS